MKSTSPHVSDVKQASIAQLDPQFAIAPIIGYRVQAAVTTLDPLSLEYTTQISYECLVYHKIITNYTSGNVPFFNGNVLIKKQNEKPFIEEVLIQAHSVGDAFCDVFEAYQDTEDFFILGIIKSQIIRIMSTTTIVNE